MSLLPILFNDFIEDLVTPSPTLYDQHFGLGIPSVEAEFGYPRLSRLPLSCGYLRPWRNAASADSGLSSVESNKDEFKVSLDVQQFKPEEINVKLQDKYLVVEGKHEERQDKHGFISRQFQRRYKLPESVDEAKIKSTLSSDGVLTLHAPKMITQASGERVIPVQATNKPAIKQTTGKQKSDQEKMES